MAIEFRKDGPWELPAGWVWARLDALGQWTGGGTPSKSNHAFWEGGSIPWVSPKT
jgi:type I restriction enzyme S subunit